MPFIVIWHTILNANIRALNMHVESPKWQSLYTAAHIRICILLLLGQWRHLMKLTQLLNFSSWCMHILTSVEMGGFRPCLPCAQSPQTPYTVVCVTGALWALYVNWAPVGKHTLFCVPPTLTHVLYLQNTGSEIKLSILRWWQQSLKARMGPSEGPCVPALGCMPTKLALLPRPLAITVRGPLPPHHWQGLPGTECPWQGHTLWQGCRGLTPCWVTCSHSSPGWWAGPVILWGCPP